MIGRLDAPGAKLDPVMPGLLRSRSPSVLAPLRRISAFGTTVTVANWSVTTGRVPGCGVSATGAGAGSVGAAAGVAGAAGAAGAGRGFGGVRLIGLATVTSTCGRAVWPLAAAGKRETAAASVPLKRAALFDGRRMRDSRTHGECPTDGWVMPRAVARHATGLTAARPDRSACQRTVGGARAWNRTEESDASVAPASSFSHRCSLASGGANDGDPGKSELAMRLTVAQIAQKSLAPVWRSGSAGARRSAASTDVVAADADANARRSIWTWPNDRTV